MQTIQWYLETIGGDASTGAVFAEELECGNSALTPVAGPKPKHLWRVSEVERKDMLRKREKDGLKFVEWRSVNGRKPHRWYGRPKRRKLELMPAA